VESARHYLDADGETLRELDVVSQAWCRHNGSDDRPWVQVAFVVECKASRKHPWVAFLGDERFRRDESVLETMRVEVVGGPVDAYGDRIEPLDISRLRGLHNANLLHWTGPIAYAVTEAGGADDGGSQAYKAVRQVTAGVDGLGRDLVESTERAVLRISIPIVVTSAPLVTCRLGERGEEVVEEAEKVLLVARLRPAAELSSVWVVQEGYLDRLAEDARSTIDRLFIT